MTLAELAALIAAYDAAERAWYDAGRPRRGPVVAALTAASNALMAAKATPAQRAAAIALLAKR